MKDAVFGIELRGSTTLDRCTIRAACKAKNAAGVLVRSASASPRLQGCTIHGCGHAGMILASGARGSIGDCAVSGCGANGVLVLTGCALTAQGCTVVDCAESAFAIGGRAAASLSACELRANGGAAGAASVAVKPAGRAALRECKVLDGTGMGVSLADGAECDLEVSAYNRVITPSCEYAQCDLEVKPLAPCAPPWRTRASLRCMRGGRQRGLCTSHPAQEASW